jgi:hypothetical protein
VSLPLSHWVVVISLACGLCPSQAVQEQKVKVTVVVILACPGKEHVDPQLKWIAKEVRKKDKKLTCFKLKSTKCKSLAVDEKGVFPLVDGKTVTVVVKQGADKENRVGVAVTAPDQGEIVYRTVCGKFLPIVTRYQTKANERLILAVRVQPCNGN